MKLELTATPREFIGGGVKIRDFGKLHLDENEMVSLVSVSGKECDVTAKDWGFYLAPSLNARLRHQGFKVALVVNGQGKLFLNAVDMDKIENFQRYLQTNQDSKIITWLDEWEEK
jgi:hypothetical protein